MTFDEIVTQMNAAIVGVRKAIYGVDVREHIATGLENVLAVGQQVIDTAKAVTESETNAKASEEAAAKSATAAAGSASAAKTSETNAKTSADRAEAIVKGELDSIYTAVAENDNTVAEGDALESGKLLIVYQHTPTEVA